MESEEELDINSPGYIEAVSSRFSYHTPSTRVQSNTVPNELRSLLSRYRTPSASRFERMSLINTDSIRSTNSQGYQYFYTNQYYRRGSVSYHLHNISVSLWSLPRRMADCLGMGEDTTSRLEVPRGYSDELNLSEFFSTPLSTQPPINHANGHNDQSSSSMSSSGGSLYRSEEMLKCQMIMVRDAAYACVAEIGKAANCQFDDLNAHKSLFLRTFVRDVRRGEELERSLRYLEKEISLCFPLIPLMPIDAANIEIPSKFEINALEATLSELEKRVRELNANDERMRQSLNEMVEVQHVLHKVESFFQTHLESDAMAEIELAEEEEEAAPLSSSFRSRGFATIEDGIPLKEKKKKDEPVSFSHIPWFITGVIPVEKKVSFERVLWRACRRTAFVRLAEIEDDFIDPISLVKTRKCVFIVFFKGESLKNIIEKVCTGYNACRYPCPRTSSERMNALNTTAGRITDLTTVIHTTQSHKHQLLAETAVRLPDWLKQVHVHKSIYQTLNRFTVDTNGFLAAEAWIPKNELENVRTALDRGVKQSGTSVVCPILNVVESRAIPPTFHRVNEFTRVFQSIVDSYGVADYREINPAPFTIITFPFLFAVMFGDMAHGLILLLAALALLFNEKRIMKAHIRDEIFQTFFGGRYIILLMGTFSIFTGMIYNDAFGKAFNVFGSRWTNPFSDSDLLEWAEAAARTGKRYYVDMDPLKAYHSEAGPYPIGLDPVWNVAENRLTFINSMKMKASVIIGIVQMTFGIILSLQNHLFRRSRMDVFFNFIPQMLFMTCIFSYLCVQIFVKWIFFSAREEVVLGYEYPGSYCAPSLLIGLINMFMLKPRHEGFLNGTSGETVPNCYLSLWYPNQRLVEGILLGVAVLAVPVMLIGKPLLLWLRLPSKAVQSEEDVLMSGEEEGGSPPPTPHSSHQHESFSDIVVHQAIHTIEFVLGCVSHTASYLRLWALSLAHAQLSEVLWHMVLVSGLSASPSPFSGAVATSLAFFLFAVLTLCILVLMEGLSAFLHALRLHWVEFQSKFYTGGGYAFQPFCLQQCLERAQHLSEVHDGEEE